MTKPTEYSKCTTANDFVAYTARVSNPANQHNLTTAGKLVKFLIKEQHWSPFEMVNVVLEIQTTRDISRQILRHKSFAFQEFSQRYALVENFTTDREFRLQDTKNRQNSLEVNNPTLQARWSAMQEVVKAAAMQAYNWGKSEGLAKEQSRTVLPEGLTDTTLQMNGTLRSWIHYCNLRKANGTQKEHREIAQKAWDIISEQFPHVLEAVDEMDMDKNIAKSKIELVDYMEKYMPEVLIDVVHSKSKICLDN